MSRPGPDEAGERAGIGELILVATPIGNLGDLSPRAVEVLRSVDAIACEDTRHTRKLLTAAAIGGKRLLAVHDHNEHHAANGIVELLARGQRIALVTDAGMPAISDPGERVVAAAVAAGFEVTCVPGPSAALAALAVSGLSTARFCFEGFLPPKGSDRHRRIVAVAGNRDTTVLFEAPHRLLRTLTDLAVVCGEGRAVSVSRELTKRFEETRRGTLGSLIASLEGNDTEPRGEHVIVIGAPTDVADLHESDETVRAQLADERDHGLTTKDAVDRVAQRTGRARRQVYAIAIEKSTER